MTFPNKTIKYKESSLYKAIIVLKALEKHNDIEPINLYKEVERDFENLTEYIDTLSFLFLLNKIGIYNKRIIKC